MTAQPLIALVGERSWGIIGAYFTNTGLLALWPLPEVDCPIVDISLLEDEQVHRILQSYSSHPEGIDGVDPLIEALLQCGARLVCHISKPAYPVGRTSVEQKAYK